MARLLSTLTIGLLIAVAASATSARAAQSAYCPVRSSMFGAIQGAHGNQLSVQPTGGHVATIALDNGARINAHGYSIRPGTYVGAFGCLAPDGVFHASEITLAANASLYDDRFTGVVRRIEPDRLLVEEPNAHTTGIWYVPDIDFRVGQTVTGIGMLGANGEFYPQSVNGHSVTADTVTAPTPHGSVTLSGTIKRIAPGKLYVWEPANRTTGIWFVRNTGDFHVGQTVTGTGTQNERGDFYPASVR